jgi:hypothetical protein
MSIPHSERSHALLAASSAHRWLRCTPSARLEETLPDRRTSYSAAGTLGHEMAEAKLRKHFIEPIGPQKFAAIMRKFKANEHYTPELEKIVDVFVDYCKSVGMLFSSRPYVLIEQQVDYSHIVPEGFGTADFIAVGDDLLVIADLKTGQGKPVPIQGNEQMRLYALGALRAVAGIFPVSRVRMAIIQPKVYDEPQEDEITVEELEKWATQEVAPKAQLAWKGEGEYVVGDHCQFCRARETCRARIEQFFSAGELAPYKPPIIGWDEVGEVLRKAEGIVSWYNDLKELALTHILEGGEVQGWKAVEGRGSRAYADLDKAFAALKAAGIDEAILYERKPLTPAQLEKALGKQQYRELLEEPGYVVKEPGKPALAPIEDKRPAFSKAAAVFAADANTTN